METLIEMPQCLAITCFEKAIVRSVLYFDIFNYPLTKQELFENLNCKTNLQEIDTAIDNLISRTILSTHDGYIYSNLSSPSIIEQRKINNTNASYVMRKALSYSKLISKFPFVESICISGSLSKGVFDKDGDVDYFITTKPSRLWLCRSLLIIYKKLFLLNSRKYFCVNYFVDTKHLQIPDNNIFVATEIKYLLPVFNHKLYMQFMAANNWTENYLPNKMNNNGEICIPNKKRHIKTVLEKILSGTIGEKMDDYFFKLTLKRWKRKFSHFSEEDFDLNMRTRKNVSKHHPRGYQYKVLSSLDQKIKEVENKFHVSLSL